MRVRQCVFPTASTSASDVLSWGGRATDESPSLPLSDSPASASPAAASAHPLTPTRAVAATDLRFDFASRTLPFPNLQSQAAGSSKSPLRSPQSSLSTTRPGNAVFAGSVPIPVATAAAVYIGSPVTLSPVTRSPVRSREPSVGGDSEIGLPIADPSPQVPELVSRLTQPLAVGVHMSVCVSVSLHICTQSVCAVCSVSVSLCVSVCGYLNSCVSV